MNQIYVDYHASTPIDPRVAEVMRPLADNSFGKSVECALGWQPPALAWRRHALKWPRSSAG